MMQFSERVQNRLTGGPRNVGYIWLAYSIFFFFEPIARHNSRFWMESAALYALFLAIYISYDLIDSGRIRLGLLGCFVVLGLAAFPSNPGASCITVYAASFLPFLLPSMPLVAALVVGLFSLVVLEGMLLGRGIEEWGFAAFFILVSGASNLFIARQKRMNSKLALAHEEIERLAAVAERERIARDLHDVLGHTLSLIVLKAELAGRLVRRDPQRATEEIADIEEASRTALAEVREAIGGYRSQGLAAELVRARQTLLTAGVALRCETDPMLATLALKTSDETVLSLALREAVTNIVRHAGATECRLQLSQTDGSFYSLIVEDDGTHIARREGNGLRGMRERVEAIGGRFHLETALTTGQRGTRVLVEVPVRSTATVVEAELNAAELSTAERSG